MANLWENIKRKLDQGAPKVQSADWEAMSQKIGAYPQLAPKAAKPWWLVATVFVVPVALFILGYNFWPSQNDNVNNNEADQPKTQTITPAVLPYGDEDHLTEKKSDAAPTEAEKAASFPVINPSEEGLSAAKPELSSSENRTSINKKITQSHVDDTAVLSDSNTLAESSNLAIETQASPIPKGTNQAVDENKNIKSTNAPVEEAESELPANLTDAERAANRVEIDETDQKLEQSGEPRVAVAKPATTQSDSIAVASAEAKNKAEQKTTANDSSQNEIARAASPEKSNFYKRGLGLKLQSLDFGGMALSPLSLPQAWAAAGGVTVNIERQKLRLSAGLFVGQSWVNTNFTSTNTFRQIDSSLVTRLETREEIRVNTVWVIDSFFSGRYVSDTSVVMVTDTVVETVFDTTDVTATNLSTKTVQISFAEIPLLAGYTWQRGNWGFQLKGGAVLNQVTLRESAGPFSEGQRATDFGLDAVFQPGVSYRLGTNFGLYSRWGVRQSVVQNAFLGTATTRYTWQLGLSYYFR